MRHALLDQVRAGGLPDRWYVSDGQHTVGPVALDLVVRGVRDRAVGGHCWLRHEGWRVWRSIAELGSPLVDDCAPTPTPHDPFAATQLDLDPTLESVLAGAFERLGAEACLVHERAGDGAVVRAARGPGSLDVLGERLDALDRVLTAVSSGGFVLAEPHPGPTGAALVARLRRAGASGAAALAVPVTSRARRHLAGWIEIGRTEGFRAHELAEAAELAERASLLLDAAPRSRRVVH